MFMLIYMTRLNDYISQLSATYSFSQWIFCIINPFLCARIFKFENVRTANLVSHRAFQNIILKTKGLQLAN